MENLMSPHHPLDCRRHITPFEGVARGGKPCQPLERFSFGRQIGLVAGGPCVPGAVTWFRLAKGPLAEVGAAVCAGCCTSRPATLGRAKDLVK